MPVPAAELLPSFKVLPFVTTTGPLKLLAPLNKQRAASARLHQRARTGNGIAYGGSVRAGENQQSIVGDGTGRQVAVGVVVAHLQCARANGDSAAEIIVPAVVNQQRAGALFEQTGGASNLAAAIECIIRRGVADGDAVGRKRRGQVDGAGVCAVQKLHRGAIGISGRVSAGQPVLRGWYPNCR